MNNHEIWHNISDIEIDLYKIQLKKIVEDYDGLKIYLTIDAWEKCLLFESFESYIVLDSNAREKRFQDALIDKNGIFFKAINSDYIKWLSVESARMSDLLNLKHFIIVTNNGLIELISNGDMPKLSII